MVKHEIPMCVGGKLITRVSPRAGSHRSADKGMRPLFRHGIGAHKCIKSVGKGRNVEERMRPAFNMGRVD